jgi:hypothetical protein
MKHLLILILLLSPLISNAESKPFVEAGIGAGGASTTGDISVYTPGFGGIVGGGFQWGILQLKAELLYQYYTGSKQYDANRTKSFALGGCLGVMVGLIPLDFIVLSAGYGFASLDVVETYGSGGSNYDEDRSTEGGGLILGVDLLPFHINSGKVDLGIMGRTYSYTSDKYTMTTKTGSTTTARDVQANSKTTAWQILAGLIIHL